MSFAAAMLSVPEVRLRFSQQNPSRSLRFSETAKVDFYSLNQATAGK